VLVWLGDPSEAPRHPRAVKILPKADLASRAPGAGGLPVSSLTGEGMTELLAEIERLARFILPADDALSLNRRQATHLHEAASALDGINACVDLVLAAEKVRVARVAFDQLTGRAGVEDVLDALFSRFCLGK